MKKIIKKITALPKNGEAIRYIIIGVCTTLVNFVLFTLFNYLFALLGIEKEVSVTVSNLLSVILSILFAYITNKRFVFRSHCDSRRDVFFEFVKFVGARGITMLIEVGGVFVMFNLIGINEMISKLVTQVIVIIGNYFISKLLVFKNNPTRKEK